VEIGVGQIARVVVRADMAKVIVERPRLGGGVRRPKGIRKRERLAMAGLMPGSEGMRRRWVGSQKMLNEHLAPLRRYLQSQVGRPWNRVHSEISRHLRLDSAVQSHVLDHLDDFVARHVDEVDGELIARSGFGIGRRLVSLFYVCPRTGLLRENKWRRRWKRPKPQQTDERVEIDDGRQYLRVNGIWYEVQLAPLDLAAIGQWDVVLKTRVDWHLRTELVQRHGSPVFAVAKRQLNKREIGGVVKMLVERGRRP